MSDGRILHDERYVTLENENAPYSFDENDPKYRCCCKSMHVKKGVGILVALGYVSAAMSAILLIMHISGVHMNMYMGTWPLVKGLLSSLILSSLAHVALKREDERFLLPSLVLQLLDTIFIALALILSFVVLIMVAKGNIPDFLMKILKDIEGDKHAAAMWFVIINIVVLNIVLLFQVWILNVVYKCFQFLKEKRYHHQLYDITH